MSNVANKLGGIALATAAAAMFMIAPMAGADDTAGMKAGHSASSNSCKGKSSCKGANGADQKKADSKTADKASSSPSK